MCESVMSQPVVVAGASLRTGTNNTTSAVTTATEKEVKSERKRVVTVMDEFDGGNYNEKGERKAGQHVTSTECDATAVATKACAPQRCYSNTSSNSNSSTTTATAMTMSSGSTSSSTCRTSEWIETGSCVESAGHTTTSCCPLSAAPHAPLPVRFIASTNMSSVGGATQSSRTEGPQTPRSNSSSLEREEDEENEEEEGNEEVRSRHVRSESDTTPSAASRCSAGEETTNVTCTTAQSLPCVTRCVPHVNTSEASQDGITGRGSTTIITAQGLPCHGPLMQPQRRSSLHTGQMLMCNLHYVVCDDEAYRPVMGKDAQEEKEESSTEKANGQRSEKSGASNNNNSDEHRHHGACLRHHTTTSVSSTCNKCSRSPGTSKESRRGSLTSTKTHYAFSSLAASHEGKTHRLMLLSEPSSEPLPPPPPPPPPPQTQQVQHSSHVSTRTEVTKMTNVIIAPAETTSPHESNSNSNTSSATGTDMSRQPFVMRADPATMKELHQGKVPRMPGYSMVDWAARLARERARGMPARRQLTVDEVAQHNTLNDIWIVVDDVVYDITEFQHYHPGGEALFRRCAGRDATELFYACHAWISCSSMLRPFAVGVLKR